MNLVQYTFSLFLLFILTGCNTETKNTYRPVESTEIAVRNLVANEVIPQQNFIITTQRDWYELLVEMESVEATEDLSGAEIDFDSYNVLAVFDAIRPHTGYSIRVNQVLETNDHLLVKVSS